MSVINLSSIPCPQSNLYTDRYNLLLKISMVHQVVHGPGWSVRLSIDLGPCFVYVCFHVHVYDEKQAQLGVVHGPGPWGGPWTRSTGVVHGPGSMFCIRPNSIRSQAFKSTGGPDVVFDSSADKTMYENTLNIALNRTCIKDLNENVLHYVYLTLF